MGRVRRLAERRVLRRVADQGLTLPALEVPTDPPAAPRTTTHAGYVPPDRDAHEPGDGARYDDQWATGGPYRVDDASARRRVITRPTVGKILR